MILHLQRKHHDTLSVREVGFKQKEIRKYDADYCSFNFDFKLEPRSSFALSYFVDFSLRKSLYVSSVSGFIHHSSIKWILCKIKYNKNQQCITLNIFTNNVTHNVHMPMNDENILFRPYMFAQKYWMEEWCVIYSPDITVLITFKC